MLPSFCWRESFAGLRRFPLRSPGLASKLTDADRGHPFYLRLNRIRDAQALGTATPTREDFARLAGG
jgi:hypothetical protein